MQLEPRNKTTARWRRVRQASLAGVTLAFTVAACTDDAIVYPNRGLHAAGGSAGDAGALAAAGDETGSESGGASSVGGNGASATGGGSIVDDEAGAGAAGVVEGNGSCGNGIVEPPEECDDGNTVSGDGCSAQCKNRCETCESKVCSLASYDFTGIEPTTYDACYKAVEGPTGKIMTGPAQGSSRAQVCSDLIDCIRREKCAQPYRPADVKFNRCWCDVDWAPQVGGTAPFLLCTNPATFVAGKCASQFQDASEADGAADVFNSLQNTARALGAALRLLVGCDEHVCTEECLPEYFGDTPVATIAQDLTATGNASGESQLGDLTADAERAVAHADAAILVPSSICGDDGPCRTLAFSATPNRMADADGRVLWSEALATQLGYGGISETVATNVAAGSAIVTATFTGQQLYNALTEALVRGASIPALVSGLTYTWKDAVPTTSREVVEIRKDGVAIDKAATLTVAFSDFLVPKIGGDPVPMPTLGMGANPTVVPSSTPITLFGQYLSSLPQPISPPALDRITCVNCPDGSGGSGGSSGSGGNGGH